MSDINDLGFEQQDDENGKAFYLDYSHSQIERLLDKIAAGYVFSEAQFNKLIKEIGLDNISTFDGKYDSLEGKPAIPRKMSELENDSLYQTQEHLNAKILALRESLVSEVKSAYDIACDHGFEGSEEEWLASLKGETGPKGDQGIQGEVGPEGPAGETYDDSELRERIDVLETLNLETKPYIDKDGMLVLCGCSAVARGVGDEVHVTTRFFNDEEDKFVFTNDEFANLRICMGYGAEGVGTKRSIVETTLELYDIDKVFIIDGGSQVTGEVGTVNIIAERCNYIHTIQGARAMNGGEKNIIHDFNVNIKDVKLLNILFTGGNGYSVTWNSNVVINNTSINSLHGGGSNGYTNSTVIEMNGGNVNTFYGVNRGIVNKYKFVLNDGQIQNFWAGCDEGTPVVNSVELELNGGQINKFQLGVCGEGSLNPNAISGHIMDCVVVDGDVSMLEVKEKVEEDINIDLSEYAKIEFVEEQIAAIELKEGPKGDQGDQGPAGDDGKDGIDGIGVKSIAIENNHLMVTLTNDEVIDAGEMPAGAGGANSEEVEQLKSEVAYLQSEIDHMMMQIADDTYGVVYEWVYHFNLNNGDSSINVAHVKELWDDVEAMGIDPFLDAIYEEDSYRLYVLRCASDYKYMNRYEVIPVDSNPMQQIGAIASWDPVKDITSWTFEGDIEKPVIDLDGAPTSDMILALLKVKK